MNIPMTIANFGRPSKGLPTMRLVNAYIEKADAGPKEAARIPRPGLTSFATLGAGPITRMYHDPGLFNGDLFTISAGELYRNTTKIGDIAYGTQPRMVAANNQLVITSGGALYVYDGTTLSTIIYFDDGSSTLPSFSSVAVLYNIFVYPVAGSNQFYFSKVGDATSINAANVSAVQTTPSPILEVAVLAEELVFFKPDATEFWDYNGALTAPFALAQGRTYIRGTAAQGSVVKLDNALFWIGDDLSIYRSSNVPQDITTPFIADRLSAAGTALQQMTAFYVPSQDHAFYVINLPSLNESYAYDCQTREWAQWGTQQPFQAEPGLFLGYSATGFASEAVYVGSYLDGTVYTLDPNSNKDGSTAKRVVVSAAHWMDGNRDKCNNVALACVRGVGRINASNPVVQMRFSDDGGRTFTSWFNSNLGFYGDYTYKAVWRALGSMNQPGRLFEFAVADDVNFTVEGVTMNNSRV